ncbi:hypothetical protein DS745_09455 [Anaerobacillus alkaliphilus]|uniref:Transposase IS200-like domain-containing protein n=1 Tax=Anaerobacillus alkaliphilus TaxID=1548597 RepID=A0A4Q0VUQ3_9BACI|nr:hypothetical protein [Anaerobacillus alkaliphilus]RXJ01695.1 hypothetical protein DS745_09455 [Anaerobacillus alkaliphilus]
MVKKHPVWFPGAIYHVSCFGTWNESIFFDEKDYIYYLSSVENVRYQFPFYLHSYCLTSHQVHLLIETIHVPLQDVITSINSEYLHYFQDKYPCLLEPTHHDFATLIDSVASFLKASRSIHLASIGHSQELKDYRWSSYPSFISKIPNDHVVTSRVLTYFQCPKMDNYALFVEGEEFEAKFIYHC